MSKFKVGDKVRAVVSDAEYGLLDGSVHTVTSVHPYGNICLADTGPILWYPARFELVQNDAVLTPEEVFEHLRKGTKLQWLCKSTDNWRDYLGKLNRVMVIELLDYKWRIKPEPEIIELNGKKYREIVE